MVMFWTRLRLWWWILVSMVGAGWRRLGKPDPSVGQLGDGWVLFSVSRLRLIFFAFLEDLLDGQFPVGKGVSELGEATSG